MRKVYKPYTVFLGNSKFTNFLYRFDIILTRTNHFYNIASKLIAYIGFITKEKIYMQTDLPAEVLRKTCGAK